MNYNEKITKVELVNNTSIEEILNGYLNTNYTNEMILNAEGSNANKFEKIFDVLIAVDFFKNDPSLQNNDNNTAESVIDALLEVTRSKGSAKAQKKASFESDIQSLLEEPETLAIILADACVLLGDYDNPMDYLKDKGIKMRELPKIYPYLKTLATRFGFELTVDKMLARFDEFEYFLDAFIAHYNQMQDNSAKRTL